MDLYIAWKAQLGEFLDVDPRSMCIIGSAGVGVSLNPYEGLKPFGPESDVEAGVERLRRDLDSGEWRRRNAELLERGELDAGYRLVVSG